MTDIAERLRALVILDEVGSNNPLGREAAARIEALEAALRKIVEINQNAGPDAESGDAAASYMSDVASDALASRHSGGGND